MNAVADTSSTFRVGSAVSGAVAVVVLQDAGYGCGIDHRGELLLTVRHPEAETVTVQRMVFDVDPDAMFIIM